MCVWCAVCFNLILKKKKVCVRFEQVAKGGGQNKKDPKGRGRPSGETPRSVIGYIMSIDTTVMPSQNANPTCFNPSSHTDTLTCCICLGLLNRPVQLSCDNLICANCCCESIRQSHSLDSPCCNTHTLSDDYEYLCKIYGLSGASGMCNLFKYFIFKILTSIGRHNCLWCTIPSSKLAEPPSKRTPFPLRSLESLAEDHRKFLTQGKGNLKVAKLYNNVISDTLFDTPHTNVR